jgi:hypothetical protein
MIKSRKVGWAGHVTRMGKMRSIYETLIGRPERKRIWETCARREDNFKMDLKWGMRVWTGFNWLGIRTTGGFL